MPQGPPAQAQAATEAAAAAECEVETIQTRPHRISWARLLKRVFDIDMQHCPNCGGGEFKIIAAILEQPVIETILTHLGLQAHAPPRSPAREQALQAALAQSTRAQATTVDRATCHDGSQGSPSSEVFRASLAHCHREGQL